MSQDDPLIQGPSAQSINESNAAASTGYEKIDIEGSNPAQDFMNLLRRPSSFFQSIPLHPDDVVVLKAIVGAIALTMLAKFASSGFRLESGFGAIEQVLPQLSSNADFNHPVARELLDKIQTQLKGGLAVMGHLGIVLIPLMMVSEIIMKALSIKIFLPLVSHVPKDAVPMKRLLTLLAYPKWLGIFAIVPFTGWLVNLGIFVFTLAALRWTYKTPALKTFVAYIFLDLIINLGIVALAFVFLASLALIG